MKLNMGCGHNKLRDFINVDSSPYFEPDVVHNLERAPWPWPDSSADEVMFIHSLEHMGQSAGVFLGIMMELYRICKDGAKVTIHVPHPRHEHFIGDPTHVRIITPVTMMCFDRELCESWLRAGNSNSKLALQLNVDFTQESVTTLLDQPYAARFDAGNLDSDDLDELMRERNNIAKEYQIVLKVRKNPVKSTE